MQVLRVTDTQYYKLERSLLQVLAYLLFLSNHYFQKRIKKWTKFTIEVLFSKFSSLGENYKSLEKECQIPACYHGWQHIFGIQWGHLVFYEDLPLKIFPVISLRITSPAVSPSLTLKSGEEDMPLEMFLSWSSLLNRENSLRHRTGFWVTLSLTLHLSHTVFCWNSSRDAVHLLNSHFL